MHNKNTWKLSTLWPSRHLYSYQEEWGEAAGVEVTGGRGEEGQWSCGWEGNCKPDGHQMNKLWRAPFCRMGVNLPPGSPHFSLPSPYLDSLPVPPFPSPLCSSSLLLSLWQFNFPPLASLLLPANCEWSLIIGPPHSPSVRGYRRVSERRLECQNVIRDSEHSERGRSHAGSGGGGRQLGRMSCRWFTKWSEWRQLHSLHCKESKKNKQKTTTLDWT